nr:50S ribosomal protein L25 [candidate division Zixibacteria bacterium]
MDEIRLSAEKRIGTGKGTSRQLRMKGFIPGVLYGPEVEPFSLSLNNKELAALMRTGNSSRKLIDLLVNGENDSRKVIIRDLQRDPVSGDFKHVDLYQVSMKKKLTVPVRIHLIGTPEGVKLGGILQHIIREIEVECLPTDIPDRIDLDVSSLMIGDVIHVSELSLEKVEILDNPKRTIVTVVPPTVIKTAAETAAEAGVVEGEEVAEGEGEGTAEGEEKKEDEGKE